MRANFNYRLEGGFKKCVAVRLGTLVTCWRPIGAREAVHPAPGRSLRLRPLTLKELETARRITQATYP